MDLRYYVIDAFADAPFSGNPAGVCLPDAPLSEACMQSIAAENNLPETAFATRAGDAWQLRWFTPEKEIDLCGHATLATGFVLMRYVCPELCRVDFQTASGRVSVRRAGEEYVLDFPRRDPAPCALPAGLAQALGARVLETYKSRDYVAVLGSEKEVAELTPDVERLRAYREIFGVVVTAPGESCDFVSRFFAPDAGIPEDPVTGSSHAELVPLWSGKLGKTRMQAKQLSRRGGCLSCVDAGDRVYIAGKAVCYLEGTLHV